MSSELALYFTKRTPWDTLRLGLRSPPVPTTLRVRTATTFTFALRWVFMTSLLQPGSTDSSRARDSARDHSPGFCSIISRLGNRKCSDLVLTLQILHFFPLGTQATLAWA